MCRPEPVSSDSPYADQGPKRLTAALSASGCQPLATDESGRCSPLRAITRGGRQEPVEKRRPRRSTRTPGRAGYASDQGRRMVFQISGRGGRVPCHTWAAATSEPREQRVTHKRRPRRARTRGERSPTPMYGGRAHHDHGRCAAGSRHGRRPEFVRCELDPRPGVVTITGVDDPVPPESAGADGLSRWRSVVGQDQPRPGPARPTAGNPSRSAAAGGPVGRPGVIGRCRDVGHREE